MKSHKEMISFRKAFQFFLCLGFFFLVSFLLLPKKAAGCTCYSFPTCVLEAQSCVAFDTPYGIWYQEEITTSEIPCTTGYYYHGQPASGFLGSVCFCATTPSEAPCSGCECGGGEGPNCNAPCTCPGGDPPAYGYCLTSQCRGGTVCWKPPEGSTYCTGGVCTGAYIPTAIYLFEDLNRNGVWDSGELLIDPDNQCSISGCGGRHHFENFTKSIGQMSVFVLRGTDVQELSKNRDMVLWPFTGDPFCQATAFLCLRNELRDPNNIAGISSYWTQPIDYINACCADGSCGGVPFSRILRDWGSMPSCCEYFHEYLYMSPAVAYGVVHFPPESMNEGIAQVLVVPPRGWQLSPNSLWRTFIFSSGNRWCGYQNQWWNWHIAALGLIPKPPEISSLTGDYSACIGSVKEFVGKFKDEYPEPKNNLVQNGSFEEGTRAWSLEGGGTKGVVSDAFFGGNAIYVLGGSPRARVIQWVPIGNNQQYTLSLSSKKTGGWVKADEWCLGGASGNRFIATRLSASNSSSYQRTVSPFTSGTCNTDQDHRLAIFFDADSNQEIWVDGVLLEAGTTRGVFSNIKSFQFNLENEDDSSYSSANWPIRIHFDKNRSGYNRDTYQVAVEPASGQGWTEGSVAFDEATQRWYLVNDLELKKGQEKYATLLGGVNNTYFFLTGAYHDTIEAHWKIRFELGFNLENNYTRTFYTTLFVNDLDGFQDEIAETDPSNILFINNSWYFHRMRQFSLIKCGIEGNVYEVSNNQCSGSQAPSNSNWNVVCRTSNYSGVAEKTSPSSFFCYVPNVDAPQQQVVVEISPPLGWEVAPTNLTGCTANQNPRTIVISGVGGWLSFPFYIWPRPDPWFQTKEGDVHAGGTIYSQIPSTATSPYFSLKGTNNNGVISWAGASEPNFGSGQAGEDKNWLANSQAKRNSYNYFYQLLGSPTIDNFNGDLSEISGDGVYYSADDVTINDNWAFPSSRKAAILIEGKLTINEGITVPQGSSLVFIVSGDIEISPEVEEIAGIFITDGTFSSPASNPGPDSQLVVNGGVVAEEFDLSRSLGNNSQPAEKFVFRPDFLINSYPGLWSAPHIWQELAP
ncbi:MAG: hypothetical protein ACPLXP_01625 [Microgenomates group bacterium]